MARITIIQTGGTLVSSAVPDRSSHKNPLAYTDLFQRRLHRIEVPVKCFLVESRGRRVLVDCGWADVCATDPRGHMGFGLWFASEPVLAPGEGLGGQLARLGIAPGDIDAVLLTHLDCDHASGLADVAGAKAFYVSAEELAVGNKGGARYNPRFWEGIDFDVLSFAFDPAAPFGRSCDLFGDGSIVCHFTPTHSAGSLCVEVCEDGRFALLTGDNAYNRTSWEQGRLPGPIYDKTNMREVLSWIAERARDPRCAATLAAHDPEVAPGVIEL